MTAHSPQTRAELCGWNGSTSAAREIQNQLAKKVVLTDDFGPLKLVAGVDVGFEDGGKITRAAVVLLDAETLEPLGQVATQVARPTTDGQILC